MDIVCLWQYLILVDLVPPRGVNQNPKQSGFYGGKLVTKVNTKRLVHSLVENLELTAIIFLYGVTESARGRRRFRNT